MTKNSILKLICIALSVVMVLSFSACSKKGEEETTEPAEIETETETESETTTEKPTETTTAVTTTAAPETTTKPDGSSIQNIVDTLESKNFYMAGTINLTGGQTMEAKANCSGDDYRLDINSSQMKMSVLYFGGVPYVANMSTNKYAELNEQTIGSLDQVLSSLSAYGISMNNQDISEMKSMMSNFDSTLDYSKYINNGEYSEYTATIDGQEYLCSMYATEYGKIRIYTQNGELKIVDVFDTDGLRQMNFIVSTFIPTVVTPVSLNGLTKTTSILNLFTAS